MLLKGEFPTSLFTSGLFLAQVVCPPKAAHRRVVMRLLITNFYSSLVLDMNANICSLDRLTFKSIRVRCSLKGKVKRTITVEHMRHHEPLLILETFVQWVWDVSSMTGHLTFCWGCKVSNIRPHHHMVHPILTTEALETSHWVKQIPEDWVIAVSPLHMEWRNVLSKK
jgi:hypothetical protein